MPWTQLAGKEVSDTSWNFDATLVGISMVLEQAWTFAAFASRSMVRKSPVSTVESRGEGGPFEDRDLHAAFWGGVHSTPY